MADEPPAPQALETVAVPTEESEEVIEEVDPEPPQFP